MSRSFTLPKNTTLGPCGELSSERTKQNLRISTTSVQARAFSHEVIAGTSPVEVPGGSNQRRL